jgi:hypothetical protein
MSGTPEPTVCIDPATGREVYAPTGEPIDMVVTVAESPLPREELGLCLSAVGQAEPADAARWALLGALLVVGFCAGLVRRYARIP